MKCMENLCDKQTSSPITFQGQKLLNYAWKVRKMAFHASSYVWQRVIIKWRGCLFTAALMSQSCLLLWWQNEKVNMCIRLLVNILLESRLHLYHQVLAPAPACLSSCLNVTSQTLDQKVNVEITLLESLYAFQNLERNTNSTEIHKGCYQDVAIVSEVVERQKVSSWDHHTTSSCLQEAIHLWSQCSGGCCTSVQSTVWLTTLSPSLGLLKEYPSNLVFHLHWAWGLARDRLTVKTEAGEAKNILTFSSWKG